MPSIAPFLRRTGVVLKQLAAYTLPRTLLAVFTLLAVGSLITYFTLGAKVAQQLALLHPAAKPHAQQSATRSSASTSPMVTKVQSPATTMDKTSPSSASLVAPSTPQTVKPAPAPAPPPTSKHFSTLPVGASLPSGATCAAAVRSVPETRPANAAYNQTKGTAPNGRYPRVDGNFTGTTDEILQWVACKWGIDEDMVRAQAAKESWWFMRTTGDFTTDPSVCAPGHQTLGADGTPGECPESIGILQVRYQYHTEAFQDNNATNSTAYNADYMYAVWRDCFEGNLTWLNTVDRGSPYAAGDAWGCVGVWFSGRWYTSPAVTYIHAVKDYLNQRVWEQDYFKSAT